MRQLSKEERELTERGIKKFENEIKELKEELNIRRAYIKFYKAKKEYEDLVRPYNEKIEIAEANKRIEMIEENIKAKTHSITEMNKHLKEGVPEKKTPAGTG